jgi:hypothetical protein
MPSSSSEAEDFDDTSRDRIVSIDTLNSATDSERDLTSQKKIEKRGTSRSTSVKKSKRDKSDEGGESMDETASSATSSATGGSTASSMYRRSRLKGSSVSLQQAQLTSSDLSVQQPPPLATGWSRKELLRNRAESGS